MGQTHTDSGDEMNKAYQSFKAIEIYMSLTIPMKSVSGEGMLRRASRIRKRL